MCQQWSLDQSMETLFSMGVQNQFIDERGRGAVAQRVSSRAA